MPKVRHQRRKGTTLVALLGGLTVLGGALLLFRRKRSEGSPPPQSGVRDIAIKIFFSSNVVNGLTDGPVVLPANNSSGGLSYEINWSYQGPPATFSYEGFGSPGISGGSDVLTVPDSPTRTKYQALSTYPRVAVAVGWGSLPVGMHSFTVTLLQAGQVLAEKVLSIQVI